MEDDGGGGRNRRYEFGGETNATPAGLTLGGILSIKQTPPYRIQDRTLLDLIRDDQTCGKESKTTWKMFREKLRLKLAGSVCTTNLHTLASHVLITADGNRVTTRHGSTQQNSTGGDESRRLNSPPVRNSSSVTETQTEILQVEAPVEEIEQISTEENRGGGGEGEPAAAARMSLMSLLEVDGSAYLDDDDEEEEEAEEEVVVVEEGRGGGGGGGGGGGDYKYNNCCVCMIRHKGAAFIPCGHTFCRQCSRELFVQRASCPLCNNFILEILDIF